VVSFGDTNIALIATSRESSCVGCPDVRPVNETCHATLYTWHVASMAHLWRMIFTDVAHAMRKRHSKTDRLHRLQPMEIVSIFMCVRRLPTQSAEKQAIIYLSEIHLTSLQTRTDAKIHAPPMAHFCAMGGAFQRCVTHRGVGRRWAADASG